jgi:hypothetical protein
MTIEEEDRIQETEMIMIEEITTDIENPRETIATMVILEEDPEVMIDIIDELFVF